MYKVVLVLLNIEKVLLLATLSIWYYQCPVHLL
jgi:hypothetical protein